MVEDRLLAGIRMTLNADEYLDALERQYRKALIASRQTKPDVGRIADLKGQIDNLVSAIASGGMRSSPAIGRKLAEVEAELERLDAIRPELKVIPLKSISGRATYASQYRTTGR
jgi:hypothetical protein